MMVQMDSDEALVKRLLPSANPDPQDRLGSGAGALDDLALDYKPMFHYLSVKRMDNNLVVRSHFLKTDFSGFDKGISFNTKAAGNNLAAVPDLSAEKKGN